VLHTDCTGLSSGKRHEESKVLHCWCEIWHQVVETRKNAMWCHIPTGKGKTRHSVDRDKQQKGLNIPTLDTAQRTATLCPDAVGWQRQGLDCPRTKSGTLCLLM
jgi:hypothetical protein